MDFAILVHIKIYWLKEVWKKPFFSINHRSVRSLQVLTGGSTAAAAASEFATCDDRVLGILSSTLERRTTFRASLRWETKPPFTETWNVMKIMIRSSQTLQTDSHSDKDLTIKALISVLEDRIILIYQWLYHNNTELLCDRNKGHYPLLILLSSSSLPHQEQVMFET